MVVTQRKKVQAAASPLLYTTLLKQLIISSQVTFSNGAKNQFAVGDSQPLTAAARFLAVHIKPNKETTECSR